MTRRSAIRLAAILAALALLAAGAVTFRWYQAAKQEPDPAFDVSVSRPTYGADGPVVLFDEAHHNFHTAARRYKPFADLIGADGYRVRRHVERFTASSLQGGDVLVVANALGAWLPVVPGAERPAFTAAECDAVRDWVHAGGALLLIADHEPAGAAAQELANRFGIHMSTGRAFDPDHYVEEIGSLSWILLTRDNGLVIEHAITRGRDPSETVNRIIAFTGQSLGGADGSQPFLGLGPRAFDESPSGNRQPAAGRALGVALNHGKGRVVAVGEAAMLTAQLVGSARRPLGMNYPGTPKKLTPRAPRRWKD